LKARRLGGDKAGKLGGLEDRKRESLDAIRLKVFEAFAELAGLLASQPPSFLASQPPGIKQFHLERLRRVK